MATWNVMHGNRPDGVIDVELVGRTVASWAADVVALQELDARARRSDRISQAEVVATMSAMRHVFVPAGRLGLLGRHGVALLSRGTIDDVEVVRLPGAGERRVALVARTERVSVAVTHLSRVRDDSSAQLSLVLDRLLARTGPHVVLGDLNRRSHEVDLLGARGFAVADGPPTYPADVPRLRIDHVAVAGVGIGAVDVPFVPVSDHRPVVVDLT